MFRTTDNKGFIGRIVLLMIALIALNAIWDINVFEYLKSPAAQEILQPITDFFKEAWAWLDDMVRKFVAG